MVKPSSSGPKNKQPSTNGRVVIKAVLDSTNRDVKAAAEKAAGKPFKKDLNFAISFAKYMGIEIAHALEPHFPGIISGEKPSRAVRGVQVR